MPRHALPDSEPDAAPAAEAVTAPVPAAERSAAHAAASSPASAAPAAATAAEPKDPGRWIALLTISLSVAIIIVDSTIVAVTMPAIVKDLGLDSSAVQWAQESYTLMFAALLLVFGALADRFGRRRMLVIGLVLFGLSSFAVAMSPDGAALIGARLVQGVGGAMIMPATLSLINANYHGRERGIAFAVWGSTIGGMAALGPLLGGGLTTSFSWHWAFTINVPIVLLILLGILLTVRESRNPDARSIDLVGALLATIASATLVFGLIEGRTYGWWTLEKPFDLLGMTGSDGLSPVPVAFAIALVSIILFIVWCRARSKAGKPALLELGLFGITSFRNGNLVAMLVSLGEFGIILSLPLWMQSVLGYDALHAGYALAALAVGSFVSSGAVQPLGRRLAPVWIVRIGLALEILGIALLAWGIAADTVWWQIAGPLAIYGMGVGFATAQLTGVILADVPKELSGQASGTQSTSRQVGSALGIAILGTVLFGSTGSLLSTSFTDAGYPSLASDGVVSAVVDSAGTAIGAVGERDPHAGELAQEAFADATRIATFTAAGLLGIALVASSSLGRGAARREGDGEDDAAASAEVVAG
ncbi:Antiseptic resistance protein [Pseudoclavibacter triregionum]|nr:Antiseptic resistance protein [Pseudoclavibacter triregionum]